MSETGCYPIACPRCGEPQEAELHDSINTRENPELRDELLANRLNTVTCPGCDYTFRVDKPLLYIDPDRGFLVHWLPLSGDDVAEGERRFGKMTHALEQVSPDDVEVPTIHLVFNRVELVERIFLLEEGLDERVIEYVKYLMYSRNAGRLDPQRKNLLFDAQDSTGEQLCFVVQDLESGQLESMLNYRRDAYQALCEMFDQDERTASLMSLFPGPYISARRLLSA